LYDVHYFKRGLLMIDNGIVFVTGAEEEFGYQCFASQDRVFKAGLTVITFEVQDFVNLQGVVSIPNSAMNFI